MSLEDKLKKFSERLDKKTETARHQYEQDQAEIWDRYRQAEQAKRAEPDEQNRESYPNVRDRLDSFGPDIQARIDLGGSAALQQIDEIIWQQFGLDFWFPNQPLHRYPVIYCETLEEFFEAIYKSLDYSETTRRQLIDQKIREAEEQARKGGGTWGVHLPGDSCYINGWLFGGHADKSPQAALNDPHILAGILETVCHEKLGHGFIAELTSLGREKQALGLGMYDLARRFNLRPVDRPDSALLRKKHELIFHASIYLEEGWATWIENILLRTLEQGRAEVEPKYRLPQLATVFQQGRAHGLAGLPEANAAEVIDALEAATHHLLLADPSSETEMLAAIRIWQDIGPLIDPLLGDYGMQPAPYVLGYLLLQRLEARLGWQNLPLAVAIAANVQYDLAQISLHDLAHLLESDPRLNPNARLALLGQLDLAPDFDRRQLIHQAREHLSLAPPAGWAG